MVEVARFGVKGGLRGWVKQTCIEMDTAGRGEKEDERDKKERERRREMSMSVRLKREGAGCVEGACL